MNMRPRSVTIIGWVYIAAGVIGLAYHLSDSKAWHPFQPEIVWVSLVRLMAIVSGVYMLRGRNWARWLALIWIGYHVVLSAFHPLQELMLHALLFVGFTYFLLRRQATQYFRPAETEPVQMLR